MDEPTQSWFNLYVNSLITAILQNYNPTLKNIATSNLEEAIVQIKLIPPIVINSLNIGTVQKATSYSIQKVPVLSMPGS